MTREQLADLALEIIECVERSNDRGNRLGWTKREIDDNRMATDASGFVAIEHKIAKYKRLAESNEQRSQV
jgi:hypothetical protein